MFVMKVLQSGALGVHIAWVQGMMQRYPACGTRWQLF